MEALDSQQRIDEDLDDLFGGFLGHLLDVHAAGLAGHDADLGGGAVRDDAQIQFLFDVQALLDQDFLDFLSFRAGLMGDQVHADDLASQGLYFVDGLGELDTAALAAPPGVDLGLDHDRIAPQGLGDLASFVRRERHLALGHGDAVFAEQFLCLIFMDFHDLLPWRNVIGSKKRNGRGLTCSFFRISTASANMSLKQNV